METDDVTAIADYQLTKDFLTASELVSLRKPRDESPRSVVGEKLYTRSDTWLENKAIESLLDSHKDMLNQKRATRVCDLIHAEWDEELNAAITSKIKGKFVHHMGRTINGKTALSPEESVFLLENGCIEIMHNKKPMSTEEAYAVILRGNLSHEKYQVYSHLSQLGFIVVTHQTKLGVTSYEKKLNLDKHRLKRKRKHAAKLAAGPQNKRLNFTGAFSTELEVNILSNTEKQDHLITEVDPGQSDLDKEPSLHESTLVNIAINENQDPETGLPLSVDMSSESNNLPSKTTTMYYEPNSEELSSSKIAVTATNYLPDDGQTIESESVNEANPLNNTQEVQNEVELQADELEHSNVNPQDDATDCLECAESIPSTKVNNPEIQFPIDQRDMSALKKNNVMDTDSQNTEVSIGDSETSRDNFAGNDVFNVKNNAPVDSFETFNKKDNAIDEEVDVDTNSDVMSCSSGSQTDVLSVNAVSDDSVLNDDNVLESEEIYEDVTLLEVTKKETKPLAVINLLSEDEQSVNEDQSSSDDEIKVVKVCSGPSGSSNLHQVNLRKINSCKKEEKHSLVPNPKYLPSQIIRYPEMYHKDVLCLARPPLELFPMNIMPRKEVYIIDVTPKSIQRPVQERVWNSFRDMQDYQRSRRQNKHLHQPVSRFRNHEINPWVTPFGGPTRDHRQGYNRRQADSHPFTNNSYLSRDSNTNSFPSQNSNQDHAPYTPSNAATMNSMVSIRQQDMNVSMVENCTFRPVNPNSSPTSYQTLTNLPNTAEIMAQVQRTAFNVATNMLSSMLGPNFNLHNMPLPDFNTFSPQQPNNPPYILQGLQNSNSVYNGQNYSNESLYNWGQSNWRGGHRDSVRRPYRRTPFPCHYRNVHNKYSWGEIGETMRNLNSEASTADDNEIEEVPIDPVEVLWDRTGIIPLVKPGVKLSIENVITKLRITQRAKLLNKFTNTERYLPSVPSFQITYDVYLPGTNYRKTCPDVPKHRIIVLRSTDDIPRYSELALLQRKWNDGALLQMAVVDNGDISFYSFSNILIPVMLPHQ